MSQSSKDYLSLIAKIRDELIVNRVVSLTEMERLTIKRIVQIYEAYKIREQQGIVNNAYASMLSQSPRDFQKLLRKVEERI